MEKHTKNNSKKHIIAGLLNHETQRGSLIRFIILVLIVLVYLVFVTRRFGAGNGFFIALLTWSFFVFCTPIADAGFLVGFPTRLLFKVRMLHSQIGVWLVALLLNLYTFFFRPDLYQNTLILKLFHHILEQPIPYWSIILISGIGTFLSIYFGDELMDVTSHKNREKYHRHWNKYQIILLIFLFVFIVILYDFLLNKMGVNIHL